MKSGADLSEDRMYRYSLWRIWEPTLKGLCVIDLNPSTADETVDDPTIRRCIGFARKWGCGRLLMLNLFAYRATKPADLFKAEVQGVNIVGPENKTGNWVWTREFEHGVEFMTLAAWGRSAGSVTQNVNAVAPLVCLGLNKDGSPVHPLYIPYETAPTPFELKRESWEYWY